MATEEQKAKAEAIRAGVKHDADTYLKRISDDMSAMRKELSEVISYMKKAESRIPEDFRRLAMAYHDTYHIRMAFTELGVPVPKSIDRVMELLHDQFEQAIADLEKPGGHFYKGRQEVVNRGGHRYDHNTPLLEAHQKENDNGSQKD